MKNLQDKKENSSQKFQKQSLKINESRPEIQDNTKIKKNSLNQS